MTAGCQPAQAPDPRVAAVMDRLAIDQLVAGDYPRALDARDWDAYVATFTDDGELDAMLVVPALNLGDHWQFTLWRRVRELIGMPSPPARTADALQELSRNGRPAGVPSRVAVIGIQSLSSRHIETIRILSRVTEVTVLLVHPAEEQFEAVVKHDVVILPSGVASHANRIGPPIASP